jgi:hypothetical protein
VIKIIATVLLFTGTFTAAVAETPASSSSAEAMISAPIPVRQQIKHSHFNAYDYSIYAGIVAYRAGDYLSTEKVLSLGGKEIELPQSFVATEPGFAVYSLGMAGMEIGGSVFLHRHGHARLARVADTIAVSTGVGIPPRGGPLLQAANFL